MTGQMVKLPDDEDTPEKVRSGSTAPDCLCPRLIRTSSPFPAGLCFRQRVDKLFRMMDKDKNAQLSFEEFQEGSKADPTIISALTLYDGLV